MLCHDEEKSERRQQADSTALTYLRQHPTTSRSQLIAWLHRQGYPERVAAPAARWAFTKMQE
jgi:hypothetical protein